MKAIEINGEIKTFARLPKSWKDADGLHLNIKDGAALGFKDVVVPEYDPRVEEIVNLHLDGDVYTYDIVEIEIKESLTKLKEGRIRELKSMAGGKLSPTDWYIIREADTGEKAPQEIKDERESLRLKADSIADQINALKTKREVVLFEIEL